MSAMRVEQLPELPAALPQDSARDRAAALWAGSAGSAGSAAEPGLLVRTRPADPGLARTQTARIRSPRAGAAGVPLRLTRRGRVVAAVAAALLLAVLSLVIAGSAQATNRPVSSSPAQQRLAQAVVQPGQSLWSVAESADPHADTRVVIQQIIALNGLTGDSVFAGQHLSVPRG